MKIKINVDPTLSEDEAEFQLRELTPELQENIKKLTSSNYKLMGIHNDRKYQLNFTEVIMFYASDKKVYASTSDKNVYLIAETLTKLSEKLPSNFLRVSNSEIVNADKIKFFDFTFGGKIKINFANGQFTYSSRSYLNKIKEYFGL